MISCSTFWEEERLAPLLRRNAGFVSKAVAPAVCDRFRQLARVTDLKAKEFSAKLKDREGDDGVVNLQVSIASTSDTTGNEVHELPEEFSRIFELDAERTFSSADRRRIMVSTLEKIFAEVQDYHQGMGFIVAYLLLFLEADEVVEFVLNLHRYYMPGYFKAAPTSYVRDARVYERILERLQPKTAEHISSMVPPEAYSSKWFIGLNVHVLPFKQLTEFLESFCSRGDEYLFCFGVGLAQTLSDVILNCKDPSGVLAALRLDRGVYKDTTSMHQYFAQIVGPAGGERSDAEQAPGSFFDEILAAADRVDLTGVNIMQLRVDVEAQLEEEARKRAERERQLAELDEEDDDEEEFDSEEGD